MESKTPSSGPRPRWTIEPSSSPELGAQVLPDGVRFGVYSRYARRIHVAIFREDAVEPEAVLPLPSCHGHIFQGFVPGLRPGSLYGFYAEGPFDPRQGLRFNPRKLLLDPYARALRGIFRNSGGVLSGHVPDVQDGDLFLDHRPSHAFMPKCVIAESRFDWEDDAPPRIPRDQMRMYETHVRGFTAHPSSGVAAPGTFAGLAEKIPYLKLLGVNAVELLPVQAKYSEDILVSKGLSNYWGYNTAAFFALEPGYGSGSGPGSEIDEFKSMVRELHRAGIEVILDVVYNHSAEGAELGPTLSFRGLDNRSYYALTGPEDAPLRSYRNQTGCGNMLDFGSPVVVRLALDSLRYLVEELHVDGFRFDLATVLGRQGGGAFDPNAPFFAAIAQDPVLRRVKLIAEPWDLEAYAVGGFPEGWMEWNAGFRDITRRWVCGDGGTLGALRDKLEGSPELYEASGREAWSSVNFATCHDGFTLRDWASYDLKHNQANGEDDRDGSNDNSSWNCGHEGDPADAGVESLRQRQTRNLLLLTALARGTPMWLGGDEILRTQQGNNNAYCQDNPLSWRDWSAVDAQAGFLRFFCEVVNWRKELDVRNVWDSIPDRAWRRCWQGWDSAGRPWPEDKPPQSRHAAFLLRGVPTEGAVASAVDPGENDSLLYLLLNTEDEEKIFNLPPLPPPWGWCRIADTSLPSPDDISPVEDEKSRLSWSGMPSPRVPRRSCAPLLLYKFDDALMILTLHAS